MSKIIPIKESPFFHGEINPYDLTLLKNWSELLESETCNTVEELDLFLNKIDSLAKKIADKGAEIYIQMTRNTADNKASEDYQAFQENIVSYYASKDFSFKKKILQSPAVDHWVDAHGETGYLLRQILQNDCDLFREENIPLLIQESELSVQYRAIIGGLTVQFEGKEHTLPEMAVYLKDKNRDLREKAWKVKSEVLLKQKDVLNELFDKMYVLRQKIASNAGFENYRDYMHQAKGRFSYSIADVYEFHESVESEVLPLVKKLNNQRKQSLGVESLRPWDLSVELDGVILRPVENAEDLLPKHITMMHKTDPLFGDNIESMQKTELLDLFNRKNKAPGGYSYPLAKYGASFIFMNAVGLHSDLTTLVHETGHAMHEFAQSDLSYTSLLGLPMEAAELASMGMEMITMPYWNEFYQGSDLKKAKYDQIEGAVRFFPWDIIVDRFQHEIYTKCDTAEKREQAFLELMTRFSDAAGIDWKGLEQVKAVQWMFQLHIFEIPFYYIEYGIAQLGALGIYKNYQQDPDNTLCMYKKFLNLGYHYPLSALYQTAGVSLNFSQKYIKELIQFSEQELERLS
ncbi:MAG: M3 family oligoendopeptidase [Brevinemataceae bacterium]